MGTLVSMVTESLEPFGNALSFNCDLYLYFYMDIVVTLSHNEPLHIKALSLEGFYKPLYKSVQGLQ